MRMVKRRFLESGLRTAVRPSYPAPFEKFNQPHLNLSILLHPRFPQNTFMSLIQLHTWLLVLCSLSLSPARPAASDLASQQSHLLSSLSIQFPWALPLAKGIRDNGCSLLLIWHCWTSPWVSLRHLLRLWHYYDPIY